TARVIRRVRESFHDLILVERVAADVDRSAAGAVLAQAARRNPAEALALGEAERAWLGRVDFLRRGMPELHPPAGDQSDLRGAIVALCDGKRSFAELRRADLLAVLCGLLTHGQLAALERHAPARYTLPSGHSVAIMYEPDRPPAARARIQEVFGLRATPR